LTPYLVARLKKLDDKLSEMGEHSDLWSLNALEKDKQWQSIREEASEILALLGNRVEKPSLEWLKYERG
jgi:hypothetical protein